MTNSRRQFLKKGAAVGITAALSVVPKSIALAQKGAPKTEQEPSPLNSADFIRCLSSQFQILLNSSTTLKMDLREVAAADTNCQCCFALVFRALHQQALRQGSYIIKNPKLGTLPTFIVPGEDAYGVSYVAVFNRLHT
jgi:hypothetical protein